ncbi:DUF402 domain-containing protein [Curtobacterium sp. NPDC090217]|uniref:DUF402 domain-containing protein n=1 Tax=Curtobacterium sp. NPDC090217 TaxID=3363970 RepID=UPI00381B7D3D
MDLVTVQKRKRPVGVHSWRGYVVAEDDWGTWVASPAGSRFVGDDGHGTIGVTQVAMFEHERGHHSVVLLPRDRWWVAHWIDDSDILVHVDISTPAVWEHDVIAYDDLELDPVLRRDGRVEVEDEDEFEEACATGLVTPLERDAAETARDDVHTLLLQGDLVALGRRRLRESVALGLPPC